MGSSVLIYSVSTSFIRYLYGTFMHGVLSSCIIEWDQADYDKFLTANRGELVNAGVMLAASIHEANLSAMYIVFIWVMIDT